MSYERMTLSQAARSDALPRPVSPSTVYRWFRPGIRAATGERVRLHAERWGGQLYVTRSALEDFARRLADADAAADAEVEAGQAPPRPASAPTQEDRNRRLAAARAELSESGL